MSASGPVVIGGMGGSGTRVPAHFVRELGFYMGEDLNPALDNLWFVLLFRRAEWCRTKPRQIPIALRLFEKAMKGQPSLTPAEGAILREAVLGRAGPSENWSFQRARSMRNSTGPPPNAAGWGWKNPSTHIFIEQLADAFPSMKYIHVIRNGMELVDRAKTRMQVYSWGPLYGIDRPADLSALAPGTALRYWIRANQRVLKLAPGLFGDRFLVLRYESLCEDPTGALTTIAEFLDVRLTPSLVKRLSAFIAIPASDHYPSWEVDQFDANDLAEVEALGYRVATASSST